MIKNVELFNVFLVFDKIQSEVENLKNKIDQEEKKDGFQCLHCQAWVPLRAIGTEHRNHCPYCLWSKHLGKLEQPGKTCGGAMIPIGLTFKKEGIDKYTGQPKQGELMMVHQCVKCGQPSINRLAGDDEPDAVMEVFKHSFNMSEKLRKQLKEEGIEALTKEDSKQIIRQLGLGDGL